MTQAYGINATEQRERDGSLAKIVEQRYDYENGAIDGESERRRRHTNTEAENHEDRTESSDEDERTSILKEEVRDRMLQEVGVPKSYKTPSHSPMKSARK